jgi:type II secretory pathway component PulF
VNPPLAQPEPDLSAAAAEDLVQRIAQVGESGAPLAAGLRAAAAEADSWRLAFGLRWVAAQVERGRPLDEIISQGARRLPRHLSGLIQAAQRTGQLGSVLSEWLENRRAARVHWRSVTAAMTYPTIVLVLAIAVFLLVATFIVQPLRTIVEEFGMQVPVNLDVIHWISTSGLNFLGAAIVLILVGVVLLRVVGGQSAWSWMIAQLPLVGDTWHWTGVSEMLRSLALLVEHGVPLPEALRLTGGGIGDAYVGKQCQDLAARLEQGTPLFMALIHQRALPLSIVPLVRWGEENDELPESLRSGAEMLEGRLRLRATLLVQILPPLIFIVVGMLVLSLYLAVSGSMVRLIQGLS